MISILHGKGFHGLRLFPRFTGAGAYRFYLFPSRYAVSSGLFYKDDTPNRLLVGHSNSESEHYFGKIEGKGLSAHKLAIQFIKTFPELMEKSKLNDYAYVGWFATLLARSEYGAFPMVSDDSDGLTMVALDHNSSMEFPMPPPPPHEVDYQLPPSLSGIDRARAIFVTLRKQLAGKSDLSDEQIAKQAMSIYNYSNDKKFYSKSSELEFAIEMSSLLPELHQLLGDWDEAKAFLIRVIEIERLSQLTDEQGSP
ncbi:hypothetical protein [Ruegeria arenilitoris]|uniref:hypothetical protein n=1 Tax=Ruegeria arenilitoris TaxID=1173585 RepID=UPI00147BCA1F|nr:hypothetical protein [Ruegeria arenilitoris]